MKRYAMTALALLFLALPLAAGADETSIPPEAQWRATPPASVVVDAAKLTELLVKKGVITPVEQAQLTRPRDAASAIGYRQLDRRHGLDYATSP
jgi:hypothetical protein